MPLIATKIQICNQALAILGVEEQVENIDQPQTRWEKRCAEFYELARTKALTLLLPSFAITDEPFKLDKDENGKFKVPSDCLRVLRVNGRGGEHFHELSGYIKTDFTTKDYIEIEYLKNITECGLWTPEFVQVLSNELAIILAPLTKDASTIQYASSVLIQNRKEYAGINAARIRIKKHTGFPFAGKGFFYHNE